LIEPIERRARHPILWLVFRLISVLGTLGVGTLAIIAFLIGLIFPWGLLLRLFGITVIEESGKTAPRKRATLRKFLVWLPGLVCAAWIPAIFLSDTIRDQYWFFFIESAAISVSLLVLLVSLVLVIVNPEQGLADRIARTRLVRR
jgi:hypothetical protein